MVNSPLYPACTIGVWTAWVNSCESTSPVALGQFISDCPRLTATCIAVGCLLARNWLSVMHPAAVTAAKSITNVAFDIGLPNKDNARFQVTGDEVFVHTTLNLPRRLTLNRSRSRFC